MSFSFSVYSFHTEKKRNKKKTIQIICVACVPSSYFVAVALSSNTDDDDDRSKNSAKWVQIIRDIYVPIEVICIINIVCTMTNCVNVRIDRVRALVRAGSRSISQGQPMKKHQHAHTFDVNVDSYITIWLSSNEIALLWQIGDNNIANQHVINWRQKGIF